MDRIAQITHAQFELKYILSYAVEVRNTLKLLTVSSACAASEGELHAASAGVQADHSHGPAHGGAGHVPRCQLSGPFVFASV